MSVHLSESNNNRSLAHRRLYCLSGFTLPLPLREVTCHAANLPVSLSLTKFSASWCVTSRNLFLFPHPSRLVTYVRFDTLWNRRSACYYMLLFTCRNFATFRLLNDFVGWWNWQPVGSCRLWKFMGLMNTLWVLTLCESGEREWICIFLKLSFALIVPSRVSIFYYIDWKYQEVENFKLMSFRSLLHQPVYYVFRTFKNSYLLEFITISIRKKTWLKFVKKYFLNIVGRIRLWGAPDIWRKYQLSVF